MSGGNMGKKIICLLGGSGFIGREIIRQLTKAGFAIRIPTRNRERIKTNLIVHPAVDVIEADVMDQSSLDNAIRGCDAVVNLVGILHQTKSNSFNKVHLDLPKKILKACIKNNINRIIHISAIGATKDSVSEYLRSKWEGEQQIRLESGKNNIRSTIIRPSIVFGRGDSFISLFVFIVKTFPVIPLIKPNAKFQPIFVQDLAKIVLKSLASTKTFHQTLEVGGPKVYTFKELLETICKATQKKRVIISLPDSISLLMARCSELLPYKVLTPDNLLSLEIDNVTKEDFSKIFDINPTSVEEMLSKKFSNNRQTRGAKRRSSANRV